MGLKTANLYAVSLFAMLGACVHYSATETSGTASKKPAGSEELHLFVAAGTVPCQGVAPMPCLRVRKSPEAAWEFFYDEIAGFTPFNDREFELLVRSIPVENPPADASSLRWELIKIISSQKPKA